MYDLWVRVGISFKLTEEEIRSILSTNSSEYNIKNILSSAFKDGRFEFDGETYIPEASIEDINREYETSYEVCEYECSF